MTRAEILQDYGIKDGNNIKIQVVQETGAKGKGALRLVGINAVGNPLKAISPKQAAELAIRLRQISQNDLANEISTAARKAQEANQAPTAGASK
jgi:hypothetical protein